MRSLFKSSFFWQFSAGFVLGAVGLLSFQPADAAHNLANHFRPAAHTSR